MTIRSGEEMLEQGEVGIPYGEMGEREEGRYGENFKVDYRYIWVPCRYSSSYFIHDVTQRRNGNHWIRIHQTIVTVSCCAVWH